MRCDNSQRVEHARRNTLQQAPLGFSHDEWIHEASNENCVEELLWRQSIAHRAVALAVAGVE